MSRAKRRMYVERYYSLDEEELQTIIAKAKIHEEKAQLELLEIFANYLTKYITMLWENKFSLGDYDIRQYVCLFIPSGKLRGTIHSKKNNMPAAQYKEVKKTMAGFQFMIQRYCTYEDVVNTVNMAFLHCVDRYERQESKQGGWVPFSGFLYSYFFYVLKKEVESLLIDQSGRKTFRLLSDHEIAEGWDSDGASVPGFAAPADPAADEYLYAESLDDMWVAGLTCYYPFTELTVQERQLLKWKYTNGDKSSEIAERLGEHPNTSRERLKSIQRKLEDLI